MNKILQIIKLVSKKIEFFALVIFEIAKSLIKLASKTIKPILKRSKKVFLNRSKRILKQSKKFFSNKKVQRRLLFIGGVILILALSAFSYQQWTNEQKLQRLLDEQIQLTKKQDAEIQQLSKELELLKEQLKKTTSDLETKTTSEATLNEQLNALQAKMEAAVMGRGGSSNFVYGEFINTNKSSNIPQVNNQQPQINNNYHNSNEYNNFDDSINSYELDDVDIQF